MSQDKQSAIEAAGWTKFDATFAEAAIGAAEEMLDKGKTSLVAHAATVVMGRLLLAEIRRLEDEVAALTRAQGESS
jgi:hypothetical protein